ncbi:hypothetical protein NEUTE2DRAFT_59774 [Neurospora tetrasperma FGSC 2509]|nr:hypothetical protein NEUTE2DRAFT_59774 [Neurospora tetrasperma FGSC 2509]
MKKRKKARGSLQICTGPPGEGKCVRAAFLSNTADHVPEGNGRTRGDTQASSSNGKSTEKRNNDKIDETFAALIMARMVSYNLSIRCRDGTCPVTFLVPACQAVSQREARFRRLHDRRTVQGELIGAAMANRNPPEWEKRAYDSQVIYMRSPTTNGNNSTSISRIGCVVDQHIVASLARARTIFTSCKEKLEASPDVVLNSGQLHFSWPPQRTGQLDQSSVVDGYASRKNSRNFHISTRASSSQKQLKGGEAKASSDKQSTSQR